MERGKFIVFEGCDRSGKSTQIDILYTMLNNTGIPCFKIAFPYYDTPIGKLLKERLMAGGDPAEMHLLFVANRYELQNTIFQKLNDGITVLCDRYKDSGITYGVASGLDEDWIRDCDSINMEPDYVVYIDIDPLEASKRADYGNGGIYEEVEFQQIIRTYYLTLIEDNWIVIDSNGKNIVDLHAEISYKLLNKVFNKS